MRSFLHHAPLPLPRRMSEVGRVLTPPQPHHMAVVELCKEAGLTVMRDTKSKESPAEAGLSFEARSGHLQLATQWLRAV